MRPRDVGHRSAALSQITHAGVDRAVRFVRQAPGDRVVLLSSHLQARTWYATATFTCACQPLGRVAMSVKDEIDYPRGDSGSIDRPGNIGLYGPCQVPVTA
jgi:hypothetical protein